jgi:hypothetical protein
MPALLVAAVLVACAVVLLAVSEEAGASFPWQERQDSL